jgi:hypothetical protein
MLTVAWIVLAALMAIPFLLTAYEIGRRRETVAQFRREADRLSE